MKETRLKRLPLIIFLLFLLSYPIYGYGFIPPKRQQAQSKNLLPRPEVPLSLLKDIDGGRFEAQNGSDWRVMLNPLTNLPSRIYGGNASLRVGFGLFDSHYLDTENLAQACKDFISRNTSLFNIDTNDLELIKLVDKEWIYFVHFRQLYEQKVVEGTYLSFIIDQEGNIVSISMNLYPAIDIDNYTTNINFEACQDTVREDLAKEGFTGSEFLDEDIILYPLVDQTPLSFTWAICFEVKISQPLRKWRYFIDCKDARLLEKIDLAYYLINGRIRGKILPEYYNDVEREKPLPDLKVFLLKSISPLYFNSLNTDPQWDGTATNPGYGWEFGRPIPREDIDGGPDPASGHTGTTVYGYNLRGSYPLNMKETQYLTMNQSIDCSREGGIGLMFWRWLGVEGSRQDRAMLEVWDIEGNNWQKVWENGRGDLYDGDWRLVFYDISQWVAGNPEVLVRWGMGPTNDYISFCGWNIDDIGVYGSVYGFSDDYGYFRISGEDAQNILTAHLEGKYFRVHNGEGPDLIYSQSDVLRNSQYKEVLISKDSQYNKATETGVINAIEDIDEINVYYHANQMLKYIEDIDPGFFETEINNFFPINITVRYSEEKNNASWVPAEGIFFGEGDGFEFRNFSHFADIIYHEVNHAITDYIYGSWRGTNQGIITRFTEFDAMHEAFSDYFACTLTDDSKIADGGFWMLPGEEYIRNLENDYVYKWDADDELYKASLVLSGAMWNLRQSLKEKESNGVRIADTLFHYARKAEAKTFNNFLVDILLVDKLKYGEAHKELILDAFGVKGISIAPSPPTSISLEKTDEGVIVRWVKNPQAVGYCLYYEQTSSLARVSSTFGIRYSSSGSSGGDQGGSNQDGDQGGGNSQDGGQGQGGGNQSSQTDNDPGEQTGEDLGGDTTYLGDNRFDLGDVDNYKLNGLERGDYIIRLTSYDKYGVESSAPAEKNLYLEESLGSPDDNVRYITINDKKGFSVTCFLNSL
ncbi:MAG: hypothetical protein ACMUJM_08715 [bacterium]